MHQYVQKHHFKKIKLGSEWVILNADFCTMTRLNDIGGFCWSLLHERQTVESLIQAIDQEYVIDESDESVERELVHFLHNLIEHGLVVVE